jgi:hypothetical protein
MGQDMQRGGQQRNGRMGQGSIGCGRHRLQWAVMEELQRRRQDRAGFDAEHTALEKIGCIGGARVRKVNEWTRKAATD